MIMLLCLVFEPWQNYKLHHLVWLAGRLFLGEARTRASKNFSLVVKNLFCKEINLRSTGKTRKLMIGLVGQLTGWLAGWLVGDPW